jgi:hypothetical protein
LSSIAADSAGSQVADRIGSAFRDFDVNGDGQLSGEELAAHPLLSRLDADGDGIVTQEEAQRLLFGLSKQRSKKREISGAAPPPFEPENSPRQGPALLKPSEHGIGAMVADLRFTDIGGRESNMRQLQNGGPLVVVAISPTCPVSKRYLPTIAELEKRFREQRVQLLLFAPTTTDTPELLRETLQEHGISAPCVHDSNGALANALGARATTDAFLIDQAGTLAYRGAIDDQYGLGYSLDAPRQRYLSRAVEALLAGRQPVIAATEAPGCALELQAAPAIAQSVTFHNRISRLLQESCMECHRAGGVAPFPLETYEQVTAKSGMIRRMVERDLMPPWFAARPAAGAHSPWVNDRSLATRDKADLLAWVGGEKPEGKPEDAPLPRRWPGEWKIGTPDAILQIPKPIEVKATGTMDYQHVSVETGFGEEKWVRGVEVQPTARDVVHHVLIFVQEEGKPLPREDGGLGGFFAAYVPGNHSIVYPDGFAKHLPPRSRLVFQIHYTPNGSATRDQVRIGLLFAKEPPRHVVRVAGIANHRLNIPPGADNHPESGSIPVLRAVKVLAFMPHMHVRGKAFRYEVTLPGGETRTLLEVPRYDFNWQLGYRYAEPPTIAAGSKMRAIGWFDNSANNPANPDPGQTVRWGPQTTDEMLLGYVEYHFAEEDPPLAAR